MRTIFFLITAFVALASSTPAFGQERTEIKDPSAAMMLIGRHMLSLQWISWDHFGSATVSMRDGIYRIKGQQKGRGNSDFLKIDGRIKTIAEKEFVFDGTIVTQVSHINGGEPCTREGEFVFKITGKRRYWRLMQMDNPCDPVTDYVDVYFR